MHHGEVIHPRNCSRRRRIGGAAFAAGQHMVLSSADVGEGALCSALAGDAAGVMLDVSAADNGGMGLVFEEEVGGETVSGRAAFGHGVGELGLWVIQDGKGRGKLPLMSRDIADRIEAEGVETTGM